VLGFSDKHTGVTGHDLAAKALLCCTTDNFSGCAISYGSGVPCLWIRFSIASSVYTFPHSLGMLYTPVNLRPTSSLSYFDSAVLMQVFSMREKKATGVSRNRSVTDVERAYFFSAVSSIPHRSLAYTLLSLVTAGHQHPSSKDRSSGRSKRPASQCLIASSYPHPANTRSVQSSRL
jgi:hypothetical protein